MGEEERESPLGVNDDDTDDEDLFGEHTFMDAGELAELLTKEEKEAQARWDDLRALTLIHRLCPSL